MTPSTWVDFTQAAVAGLVMLWGLGGPGLRALEIRGLLWLALAPTVSIGLLGVSAILARFAGIAWSPLPPIALAAIFTAIAVFLGRLGLTVPRRLPALPRSVRIWQVVGTLLSTVAILLPFLNGMRRPDRVFQSWDALYHLNAIAYIDRTHDASSLDLGAISSSSLTPRYYPGTWHGFAALLPHDSVALAFNVALVVGTVLPWIVGIQILTRVVWPHRPAAPAFAAFIASWSTAIPFVLAANRSYQPNALGMALLPGVLAFVVLILHHPLRLRSRLGALFVGLVLVASLLLAHPNAFLGLVVLLVPVLVRRIRRPAVRAFRSGHRIRSVVLVAIAIAPIIALVVARLSPTGQRISNFSGGIRIGYPEAFATGLLGLFPTWPTPLNLVLGIGSLAAVIVSIRARQYTIPAAYLIVFILYVDASTDSPLGLSAVFYSDQTRFGSLLTTITIPLVAGTIAAFVAAATTRRRAPRGTIAARPDRGWRSWRWRRSVTTVMILTLFATVAVNAASYASRLQRSALIYSIWAVESRRYLDGVELRAIKAAAPDLDPWGVVIGSPFTGASHLEALIDQPVYFHVAGGTITPDDRILLNGWDTYGKDPRFCRVLAKHHIEYLYQDTILYQPNGIYSQMNEAQISGAKIVARTITMRLYKLPACPTK